MTSIKMHPSELAYAFSYSKTVEIIGWGRDPFLPTTAAHGDPKEWYVNGAAHLSAAGRLVESAEKGLTFTNDITDAVLALVDPALVLLAERKEGDGLRRLTVHVADETLIGLTRDPDGTFELMRYANLTAAVAACVGFMGTARTPAKAGARFDTDQDTLNDIAKLATNGDRELAMARLDALGASQQDATSIVNAMAQPVAAGVLSVLYCAGNVARNAEPFSVMTTAQDETWILFPPASLRGPMVLERSSVSALTARVLVGVAARLRTAA